MTTKRPEVQLSLFDPASLIYIDPKLDSQLMPHVEKAINSQTRYARTAAFDPSTIFTRLIAENGMQSSHSGYMQLMINNVFIAYTPVRMKSFYSCLKCVGCGIQGNVFMVEKHVNEDCKPYLNLYAVDKNNAVLLTVDHMLPESFGGRMHVDNLQVMCRPCNAKKADKLTNNEINQILANLSKHIKSWVDPNFMQALLTLHIAVNDERDKHKRSELNNLLQRYRKKLIHTTKPSQYQDLTRNIWQAINPPVEKKVSLWTKIVNRFRLKKFSLWPLVKKPV